MLFFHCFCRILNVSITWRMTSRRIVWANRTILICNAIAFLTIALNYLLLLCPHNQWMSCSCLSFLVIPFNVLWSSTNLLLYSSCVWTPSSSTLVLSASWSEKLHCLFSLSVQSLCSASLFNLSVQPLCSAPSLSLQFLEICMPKNNLIEQQGWCLWWPWDGQGSTSLSWWGRETRQRHNFLHILPSRTARNGHHLHGEDVQGNGTEGILTSG